MDEGGSLKMSPERSPYGGVTSLQNIDNIDIGASVGNSRHRPPNQQREMLQIETMRKKRASRIWEKIKTKARFPMNKHRHNEILKKGADEDHDKATDSLNFQPTPADNFEVESASSSDEDDDSATEYSEDKFIAYMTQAVAPFNTRNFTHQADLPLAFDGISYALAQNAKRGTMFSEGLCWGVTPGAFSSCPHLVLDRGRSPSARPRSWLPFMVMDCLGR